MNDEVDETHRCIFLREQSLYTQKVNKAGLKH